MIRNAASVPTPTPAYVHRLLDTLLDRAPLNLAGTPIPGDVHTRIVEARERRRTAKATPGPALAERPVLDPARIKLTDREREVLIGISRGESNRVIGEALFISEDTVKTHVRRLFRKLYARDRAHAVAIAYRAGLLTVDEEPS